MPVRDRRDSILHCGSAARCVAAALALLAVPSGAVCAPPEGQPIRLTDAAERGTFTMGGARAAVSPVVDPLSHEPLLQLEYTLPRGTAAGVWAKRFPETVSANTTDVVRVRIWAPDSDQLRYVTGTLEIKGAAGGIQRIPLDMHPARGQAQTAVDWPAIGTLGEVVVAISRAGDAESVTGRLFIDVSFARRSALEKL